MKHTKIQALQVLANCLSSTWDPILRGRSTTHHTPKTYQQVQVTPNNLNSINKINNLNNLNKTNKINRAKADSINITIRINPQDPLSKSQDGASDQFSDASCNKGAMRPPSLLADTGVRFVVDLGVFVAWL